jgi:uncharacterized membrane protein YtjA (UPF0391 family)
MNAIAIARRAVVVDRNAAAEALRPKGGRHMLHWALTFFVIALIAAVLGFGGIAGSAMGIAKVLFFVFLVLFAISLVTGLVRGAPPTNI